jgi:hypothetical protein
MPQRTNEFQELVALIQKAFSPFDARITESALVDVPGMSDPREIDVLVENPPRSLHLKIAVEAKDEKRRMDIVRFEALLGKYFVAGGISVDKLVVVTRAGYSKAVGQRAKLLSIELLTLDEAINFDWQGFSDRSDARNVIPRLFDFEVSPPIPGLSLDTIRQEGAISICGKTAGTLRLVAADCLMRKLDANPKLLNAIEDNARRVPDGVTYQMCFTIPSQKSWTIAVNGRHYPLTSLSCQAHFSTQNKLSGPVETMVRYARRPHICTIVVHPAPQEDAVKDLKHAIVKDVTSGKELGTLNAWCERQVAQFYRTSARERDLCEQARRHGNAWQRLKCVCSRPTSIRVNGADHAITSVTVGIHAVFINSQADCAQYQLNDQNGTTTQLSHFVGSAGDNDFEFLLSHASDEEASKAVLKIGKDFVAKSRNE